MPCYSPISGWRARGGGATTKRRDAVGPPIDLPCNGCIGCREDRRSDWTMRILHEAQMQADNCFLTLTYDDEHLPDDWCLRKSDLTAFWKRVRKAIRREDDNLQSHLPPTERQYRKVRYYQCGEYGDKSGRPHYHACVFGVTHRDDWKVLNRRKGHTYYTSEFWARHWEHGNVLLGELERESAQYVAGYVMKKQTGNRGAWSRLFATPEGEIVARPPEFATMSRNPGIGAAWYEKYAGDVSATGRLTLNGRKRKAPLYYLRKLAEQDPEAAERLRLERFARAAAHREDATADRRAERERVRIAQRRQYTKTL